MAQQISVVYALRKLHTSYCMLPYVTRYAASTVASDGAEFVELDSFGEVIKLRLVVAFHDVWGWMIDRWAMLKYEVLNDHHASFNHTK